MLALTRSNLMMMARNRQGLFWALFFPLLLVVVFGLIDFNGVVPAPVAVVDLSDGSRAQVFRERLADVEFLEVEDFVRADMAEALREGDLGYLIVIPPGFDETAAAVGEPGHDPVGLVYTSRNPDRNQLVEAAVRGLVAEVWSDGQPVQASRLTTANIIDVPEVDYFDTVLLGLLGLGIMTNSIISIAVRISTYRNQAILKRLLATPLPIWKFFASEIAAHLLLALVQAGIILAVGVFVFGGRLHGNLGWVLLITALGSIVFLNIGFILSAWARSPAAASGMGNAVALPMVFFAGTFFSTTSLPWVLPYAAEVLPLTPMLSALRAVGLDQAPIAEAWPQLAALAGWAAATAVAATRVFKFS